MAGDKAAGSLRRWLETLTPYLAVQLRRLAMRRMDEGPGLVGLAIPDAEIARLFEEVAGGVSPFDPDAPAPLPCDGRDRSRPDSSDPVEQLAVRFGLSPFEVGVVLLGTAVEVDARYGRIVAYMNDHAAKTRPTVGLALAVFGHEGMDDMAALHAFAPDHRLRALGALTVSGEGPLPDLAYRIADPLWRSLAGHASASAADLHHDTADALSRLVLAAPLRVAVEDTARWVREHVAVAVIIRGRAGTGREALARALLADAGYPALTRQVTDEASTRAAICDATLHDAGLVLSCPEAPRPDVLASLRALAAPVVCVTEVSLLGHLEDLQRAVVEIDVERPSLAQRAELWRRQLSDLTPEAAYDLASRFRYGPGSIVTAARLVRDRCASRKGLVDDAALVEVQQVCRALPVARFGALAKKLDTNVAREDVVLPASVWREIELAVSWLRHSDRVLASWGFERRVANARSLVALFCGPSGTGKTLAARLVAAELGLDLYRIDLSAVVSKYIGETERNLSLAFDAAEEANAILFFDEADALFGKRAEVKDAHDRYANIESGFLLQRLEDHEGVTMLATNLYNNIDDAFARRIQILAQFPLPSIADRVAIWRRHLPPEAELDADVDLELLARGFETSGGSIRNAALAAAFMAADAGEQLGMKHLVRGLWRELQKAGRFVSPSAFGCWESVVSAYARVE